MHLILLYSSKLHLQIQHYISIALYPLAFAPKTRMKQERATKRFSRIANGGHPLTATNITLAPKDPVHKTSPINRNNLVRARVERIRPRVFTETGTELRADSEVTVPINIHHATANRVPDEYPISCGAVGLRASILKIKRDILLPLFFIASS